MPPIPCYVTECDFTTHDLDNAVAAVVLSHHLSTAYPSPAPTKAPAIPAPKLTGAYTRTNGMHPLENGMCIKAQSQLVRRTHQYTCLPAVARISNLALKGRTPIQYYIQKGSNCFGFNQATWCDMCGCKPLTYRIVRHEAGSWEDGSCLFFPCSWQSKKLQIHFCMRTWWASRLLWGYGQAHYSGWHARWGDQA